MVVDYILSVENKQLYNTDDYTFSFQKCLNNIEIIFWGGCVAIIGTCKLYLYKWQFSVCKSRKENI